MARVDFYVLQASGEQSRWQFACRLTEKAYKLDNRVHILAADMQAASRLDELLWTFRDGSFLPHDLATGKTDAPVSIGCETKPPGEACDLLINLTDTMPADISAFPRVAEIVTSDDEQRRHSRTRFAGYRDQGHTLETHKL